MEFTFNDSRGDTDIILEADMILNVVDAVHCTVTFLTAAYRWAKGPLSPQPMDDAENGISIDVPKLSKCLSSGRCDNGGENVGFARLGWNEDASWEQAV